VIGLAARQRLIQVALGEVPADLVVRGGRIANVFTRELVRADVVVAGQRIAAVAAPDAYAISAETEIIDAQDRIVAPGLVDPHLHVESCNLTVTELARAIVPRGVLSVCEDPHEIANVLGLAGIELLVEEAASLPLNFYLRVPGRVPALPPHIETSGHGLDARDIDALLSRPDAVCLGGDINPSLLLRGDSDQLQRIEAAIEHGRTIGGQLPGFVGPVLDAGAAAGLEDTHVAESVDEIIEQLRRGLRVLLTPRIDRLPAEEWPEIAAAVRTGGIDTRNLVLCTDDIQPNILASEGHLDHRVRLAIESGFDPVQAIQMASLNAAELMRIDRDVGAVAPGRFADLVILDDLASFATSSVIHHGQFASRGDALVTSLAAFSYPDWARDTMHLGAQLTNADMALAVDQPGPIAVNVVEFGGPKTMREAHVPVVNGRAMPDVASDVLSIAVVERHRGTGAIGRGFVGGLGIAGGAVASSVNHDSHNIFVVGDSHDDMALAANSVAAAGGGYCAVVDGAVRELVPLPIAGLLSDQPLADVASGLAAIEKILVEELGCSIVYRPMYALNFLCLPNIPNVGVTDQGIIDTESMTLVASVLGGEPMTGMPTNDTIRQ
jgi:adenine deaminase